jgi:hypothetical protein
MKLTKLQKILDDEECLHPDKRAEVEQDLGRKKERLKKLLYEINMTERMLEMSDALKEKN